MIMRHSNSMFLIDARHHPAGGEACAATSSLCAFYVLCEWEMATDSGGIDSRLWPLPDAVCVNTTSVYIATYSDRMHIPLGSNIGAVYISCVVCERDDDQLRWHKLMTLVIIECSVCKCSNART